MTKEERVQIAYDARQRGLNCGQSVMLAFRDKTGLTEAQALGIGSSMGGGVRSGLVCGTVNAGSVILGMLYPQTLEGGTKPRNIKIVKEYQRRFREYFPAYNCRELLSAKDLQGTPRAEELACDDHCGRLIYTAVELLSDYLDELDKE